jgi:hypothetical protein
MTTLKTLTIGTALLLGGVSLAIAQGPPTGTTCGRRRGEQPRCTSHAECLRGDNPNPVSSRNPTPQKVVHDKSYP